MASFGQEIKPVNADKFFVAIPQQDACMQKALGAQTVHNIVIDGGCVGFVEEV